MKKLCFLDLETTGVDKELSAIHQISGIIEIDGKEIESFDFKVRPFDGAEFSEEAMLKGNVTKELLMTYPEMSEVFPKLQAVLGRHCNKFDKKDKYHIVGYNILSFDTQFLRKFYDRCNDKYFGSWFWSGGIDVLSLAEQALLEERCEMENFKLETVAKVLLSENIDSTKTHTADYDIKITRDIYHLLTD